MFWSRPLFCLFQRRQVHFPVGKRGGLLAGKAAATVAMAMAVV